MHKEKSEKNPGANDESLFRKHKELIERIKREERLQPGERDNKSFYTTKGLFLEYGLCAGIDIALKHRLWRERGMHRNMREVLLELFNNLNTEAHYTHIEKTIEGGIHKAGTRYPDITWEALECHAAMNRIQELRDAADNKPEKAKEQGHSTEGEAEKYDAGAYEYLSLEELVELRLSKDTGSNRITTRESLLKHCRLMRKKRAKGDIDTPCALYSNDSDLGDIEIIEIPPQGTKFRFRRIKGKQ
jgi:hypothetical protein